MVFCLALSSVNFPFGAGLDMVDPAPMVAPSSIKTGATNSTPEPTKTLSPIVVLCLLTPS
jgi:hypothetical protein